jgi:hypothetical protein
MANLRSLVYTLAPPDSTNFPTEFLVYNTNVNSQNNGGRCCLWTVPAGTTWVSFEMWGSGGGGAGSCCCQQGWPGGSGSYSRKTVCSVNMGGCQYTVCAGGTTPMSPVCLGCAGNTSYVNGFGLSNFCANGGAYGEVHCQQFQGCYTCSVPYPNCCCAYGGDINVHGNRSTYTSSTWCTQYGQQQAMVAPNTVSGPQLGPGGCINGSANGSCTGWFPCSVFPGGGGHSAQTHGGNCWCGTWGGGGLVSITYG